MSSSDLKCIVNASLDDDFNVRSSDDRVETYLSPLGQSSYPNVRLAATCHGDWDAATLKVDVVEERLSTLIVDATCVSSRARDFWLSLLLLRASFLQYPRPGLCWPLVGCGH
jgi:hypothetical protein